jgi:hypothetical protein
VQAVKGKEMGFLRATKTFNVPTGWTVWTMLASNSDSLIQLV